MIKEFVPYELALRLKELGFYCDCFGDYFKFGNQNPFLVTDEDRYRIEEDNEGEDILRVPAPTFSQAFRWFREKHNLPNHIHTMWQNDWNDYSYQWHITEDKKEWNCIEHFKTYEEAELACLRKLIEIVKND